jgi:hypothetical protein
MLEEMKIMLGDAATAYTDAQIEIALRNAQEEAAAYCNRALDADLLLIAQKMAIYRLNRMNTEGLQGQAFSGVNETYINGYPAEILMMLNRKRKVKFI